MKKTTHRFIFVVWRDAGRFSGGFTLLEIFLILLFLGVMAAIAVPALSNWIPSYHLKGAAQDLYQSFQMAKSSALGKGLNCTVTFYQPLGAITYDYVVFMDTDGDLEYDAGEQVLVKRVWGGEEFPGISFDKSRGHGTGLTFHRNDDGLPAISFKSSGIPVSNTGGLGMGTAYLVNKRGCLAQIVVSSTGNVRVQ